MKKSSPKNLPITVIGVGANGPEDLPAQLLEEITKARVLVGGKRHLAHFENSARDSQRRIPIEGDLDEVFEPVKKIFRKDKTVILATGDPFYFGIGDYLLRHFAKDDMVVIPHLSSVQMAFAKIKESWHDAKVVSLHGRPMSHLHPVLNEGARKIAIFTDEKNHPAAIARELRELGFQDATLWVLENLGTAQEKIGCWDVARLNGRKFSDLNLVIVLLGGAASEQSLPALGLPDDFFEKRTVKEGMITKEELRVLALAKLSLKPHMMFWDVGSCTGSIAIEAKRICPTLSVWAVEKNAEDVARLKRNAVRALAGPVQIVHGEAPESFKDISENPHRVFIGGHGGRLQEILQAADKRLQPHGRIVVNAILPETLKTAERFFQAHDYAYEVLSVHAAKRKPGNKEQRLHPVAIVYGQRKN